MTHGLSSKYETSVFIFLIQYHLLNEGIKHDEYKLIKV